MANRHKIRDETAMSGAVAVVNGMVPVAEAEPTTDDAPAFTGEVRTAATNILPDMGQRVIMVGDWTRYQVRAGTRMPMLVTAVYGPDMIDGVAFSARPSDVGNAYGTRAFHRVRRGEGDGQWQS